MISDADLVSHLRAHEDDLPQLRSLEKAAIAAIQKRTGRYFGAEGEIVEVIPWRGSVLPLANLPLEGAITSLESWDGSVWTAEDTTGYFVNNSQITLVRAAPTSPAWFRVTYDAGYTQLEDENEWDAPEDVKQAVILQVKLWYDDLSPADVAATQGAIDSLLQVHMRLAA